jgi:hypothetical protein
MWLTLSTSTSCMPRDMYVNLYQGIVTTDFLDEEI